MMWPRHSWDLVDPHAGRSCTSKTSHVKHGTRGLNISLEANSIEILKGQLTSLLRFTVLKDSDFKTKKLNREVN